MSYQLRKGQNLGDEVRRIYRRQIELAIADSRSQRTSTHSPVHETRKHLKKARAALALLSGVVGRDEIVRADKNLRRIADLIADIRDAEVRFQTIRHLGRILRIEEDDIVQEAEAFLGLELESFLAAFSDWKEEATRRLTKMCSWMQDCPVDGLTCEQIRQTVQRSYKCGRRTLRKANEAPVAENFHEVRKHAKELMYQLRILQPVHPRFFQQRVSELKILTETLGNAHDLAFLETRLIKHKRRGADDRAASALSELIGLREKELQRTAAVLGERFYAERPREFARRLSEFFGDWETAQEKLGTHQHRNGFHSAAAFNAR